MNWIGSFQKGAHINGSFVLKDPKCNFCLKCQFNPLLDPWSVVKIEMGAVQEEFCTTNAISYADLMASVLSGRLQKQISAKLFLGI